jgi:hypothetical protein
MNRRTGGLQFSTERIVIAVFTMVRFRVRVRSCAHILKIGFRQRPLILRQRAVSCPAGTEKKCPDHGKRQQQYLGATQGRSRVINTYSQPLARLFLRVFSPQTYTDETKIDGVFILQIRGFQIRFCLSV